MADDDREQRRARARSLREIIERLKEPRVGPADDADEPETEGRGETDEEQASGASADRRRGTGASLDAPVTARDWIRKRMADESQARGALPSDMIERAGQAFDRGTDVPEQPDEVGLRERDTTARPPE